MIRASIWSIAFSLFAFNVWALDCGKQESCENLGYTYDSTACSPSKSLRCPFNLNAYWCKDPVDTKPASCADGGYVASCPSGQHGTAVSYENMTCYKNCVAYTCADGGYLNEQPSGQSCTQISYYGRTCYRDCVLPILYSDMTTDYKVISGKTPIGIVFDIKNRLAVALNPLPLNTGLNWCSGNNCDRDIPTLENGYYTKINGIEVNTDGKANTAAIIAFGKANNISYPAAEYCYNYTTEGTNTGDWFLPSLKELDIMSMKRGLIDNTSYKMSNKYVLQKQSFWSSNEENKSDAFVNGPNANDHRSKYSSQRLIPMIHY